MAMSKEEIIRMKKSIAEAEEVLKQGLILDYEASSQLSRMIYYYEQKIKEAEELEN